MEDTQEGTSSSITVEDLSEIVVDDHSRDEPLEKKRKKQGSVIIDLQARLLGVLSCSVCFDLPKKSVFQCQNGHLMCCGCFHHLLADARLKNEQPSCPSCRIEITQRLCIRNLAVEKAVSELPGECRFCGKLLPRNEVAHHEADLCHERTVGCHYMLIGCEWKGQAKDSKTHVASCEYQNKTGEEILDCVVKKMEIAKQELTAMQKIVRMLSNEWVAVCDIQLTSCRTDDFSERLYHESNRFNAFERSWTVCTNVIGDVKSNSRKINYQLCLNGKAAIDVKYLMAKGPYGEVDIKPDVQRFEFKDDTKDSDYHPIVLQYAEEDCNVLLSTRTVSLRLLMFQVKK